MKTQTETRPVWATAARVLDMYGIGHHMLLDLSREGKIRHWKRGNARTATVLYRLEDIDRMLDAEATPLAPPPDTRPEATDEDIREFARRALAAAANA